MDAQLRARLPKQVCGVRFHPRSLRTIREIIEAQPLASRAEISRQVCERLGWVDAMGRLKTQSGSLVLRDFHRRGWIVLPELQKQARPTPRDWALPDPERLPSGPVTGPLKDLGRLSLVAIDSKEDYRFSQSLLAHHHYRGALTAFGAQRRYLIHASRGCLGVMAFSAAARHLRDRDDWIGWNQALRRERRHLIVNNSRFLILPEVKVPHLASHVLSLAARQLVPDFQAHYGYTPVLLETFVEEGRYWGTCYRAANWIRVGQTRGRGRNDPRTEAVARREPPPLPIKSIWIRPLGRCDRVRQALLGKTSPITARRCA
jgi:hypothetical protein